MKPHTVALSAITAGLVVYGTNVITSQFSEPIVRWALKKYNAKSDTKIQVDNIKGSFLFNRDLLFDNVRIDGPNIQFGCENLILTFSLLRLLTKNITLFEMTNAKGKITLESSEKTKKKKNWKFNKLTLLNVDVDVSKDDKLHSLKIDKLFAQNVSKNNLNALLQANGKGSINGSPFNLIYSTFQYPLYIYAKRDILIPLDLLSYFNYSSLSMFRSGSMRLLSTVSTLSDFSKETKYNVELRDVEVAVPNDRKFIAPIAQKLNEKKNVNLEFGVVRSEDEMKMFSNEELQEFANLLLKGLMNVLNVNVVDNVSDTLSKIVKKKN